MKPWTSWLAPVGMAASCLIWVGCGGGSTRPAPTLAGLDRARQLDVKKKPIVEPVMPCRTPAATPGPTAATAPKTCRGRRRHSLPRPRRRPPPRRPTAPRPPQPPRTNSRPRRPTRRPPTSCSPSPAAPLRYTRRPRPRAAGSVEHHRPGRPATSRIPRRRRTSPGRVSLPAGEFVVVEHHPPRASCRNEIPRRRPTSMAEHPAAARPASRASGHERPQQHRERGGDPARGHEQGRGWTAPRTDPAGSSARRTSVAR